MEFCTRVLGERIKEMRKEKDISTIKLGQAMGVSDATISRWENGIMLPRIDSLYKLAKFFKISSDYLIGLEN